MASSGETHDTLKQHSRTHATKQNLTVYQSRLLIKTESSNEGRRGYSCSCTTHCYSTQKALWAATLNAGRVRAEQPQQYSAFANTCTLYMCPSMLQMASCSKQAANSSMSDAEASDTFFATYMCTGVAPLQTGAPAGLADKASS